VGEGLGPEVTRRRVTWVGGGRGGKGVKGGRGEEEREGDDIGDESTRRGESGVRGEGPATCG
jgi:hypothetical protein